MEPRPDGDTLTGRSYRIRVAAQLAGVSEGTLRAWERRYRFLTPRRTASGYRTYAEDEIELLRRIRHLTEEGMSIGEAAGLAPGIRRELRNRAVAWRQAGAMEAAPLAQWLAAILAAAERYDQAQVDRTLDDAFATLPPITLFDRLVVPLQRELGERWHVGQLTVAQEHLVTQAVRSRLFRLLHGAPSSGRRHAVCACLPEEEHEVGLLGAALRFRLAGFRVTYLGPRTPSEGLHRTVRATGADTVALSAVQDCGKRSLRVAIADAVRGLPRGTRVTVGGAAAARHPEVCERLGVRLVEVAEDWAGVLSTG